ncbi:MAG: hypothetical protein KF878_08180 [Planctomycetes bacterium]|nr:hypothetical protein [Planctomycetota bacterium]MCW8140479.1 hypothetical protein [Planctomycetota bacterium]
MLLDQRLEAVVEVTSEGTNQFGREYHEVRLVSEDGQTLHLFEGQLKELPGVRLEVGRRYTLILRPFVNNRWVELKIASITPA